MQSWRPEFSNIDAVRGGADPAAHARDVQVQVRTGAVGETKKLQAELTKFVERAHKKTSRSWSLGVGGRQLRWNREHLQKGLRSEMEQRKGCVLVSDIEKMKEEVKGLVCMPIDKNPADGMLV